VPRPEVDSILQDLSSGQVVAPDLDEAMAGASIALELRQGYSSSQVPAAAAKGVSRARPASRGLGTSTKPRMQGYHAVTLASEEQATRTTSCIRRP
jgi:hypothetical protein